MDQELYEAIIFGESRNELISEMIQNRCSFDYVAPNGVATHVGPFYWLLWSKKCGERAAGIFNRLDRKTKDKEIERAWATLMVTENYNEAAKVIS